jgi:Xaa-Pro aminopeptidase
MNSINDKLKSLRKRMKKEKLAAYIIPTNGPHMSEYPASHWGHREWISGFTGSAGTIVVTMKKAGLWTDVRYFEQAEEQLADTEIKLYKMGVEGVPDMMTWIQKELDSGARLGAAALTTMMSQVPDYRQKMSKSGLKFVVTEDLISEIWKDRPSLNKDMIFVHEVDFAGQSRTEKINDVRKQLRKHKADAFLVTALDEIGWLLNLRGSDVEFNPVFYSYLWIEKKKCVLFIDQDKLDPALQIGLAKQHIEVIDYNKVYKKSKKLSKDKVVAIDPSVVNQKVFKSLKAERIVELESPIKHLKAIKNDVEIKHLKQVMIKDGVALVRAFRWLESELSHRGVTEYEFGLQLAEFRGRQADYFGESFSPIVGYQSNGAIIHYRADEQTCKTIHKEGILLVDSGGQYLDGTTDITRTIALGEVSAEHKKHYTLVLKGHIALAKIHFPKGTTGIQLDTLARQYLWNHGLNYGHGTGHGVGFFMNVHEPPQGFAPKLSDRGTTVHLPGMYTSNEPGFYLTGSHGIRLENLVICVAAGENTDFLRHETITLFPFDLNFIDRSLMTNEEVAWLNSYHRKVEMKLSPQLDQDEKAWLAYRCRAIS